MSSVGEDRRLFSPIQSKRRGVLQRSRSAPGCGQNDNKKRQRQERIQQMVQDLTLVYGDVLGRNPSPKTSPIQNRMHRRVSRTWSSNSSRRSVSGSDDSEIHTHRSQDQLHSLPEQMHIQNDECALSGFDRFSPPPTLSTTPTNIRSIHQDKSIPLCSTSSLGTTGYARDPCDMSPFLFSDKEIPNDEHNQTQQRNTHQSHAHSQAKAQTQSRVDKENEASVDQKETENRPEDGGGLKWPVVEIEPWHGPGDPHNTHTCMCGGCWARADKKENDEVDEE